MITKMDVQEALRAVNPETTDSEIEKIYQEMDAAVIERRDQKAWQLQKQWKQHHGTDPDGMTWGQILNRAMMDAEEEIRDEYLGWVTQQLIEEELDDEDENPHLQALSMENGWKDRAWDIQVSYQMEKLVKELWLEESATFWMYAETLLMRLEFIGADYPISKDTQLFRDVTAQIRQAEEEYHKRLAEL